MRHSESVPVQIVQIGAKFRPSAALFALRTGASIRIAECRMRRHYSRPRARLQRLSTAVVGSLREACPALSFTCWVSAPPPTAPAPQRREGRGQRRRVQKNILVFQNGCLSASSAVGRCSQSGASSAASKSHPDLPAPPVSSTSTPPTPPRRRPSSASRKSRKRSMSTPYSHEERLDRRAQSALHISGHAPIHITPRVLGFSRCVHTSVAIPSSVAAKLPSHSRRSPSASCPRELDRTTR
jgi:hypothetical protein